MCHLSRPCTTLGDTRRHHSRLTLSARTVSLPWRRIRSKPISEARGPPRAPGTDHGISIPGYAPEAPVAPPAPPVYYPPPAPPVAPVPDYAGQVGPREVPRPPPARHPDDERERRREAHRAMIQKSVRMEVPIFEGSRNPKDYPDWESNLQSYFQWYDMDDDLCVSYAEARLGGQAKFFWKNEKEAARLQGDLPHTWTEMARKLKDKYIPKLYMTRLLLKWMDLKQGRRRVSEYIEEFEEYRMRCKFVESPQIQIAFFVHGLRTDLGVKVLEQNPSTVDLAYGLVESNEYSHDDSTPTSVVAPRVSSTSSTSSSTPRAASGWTRGNPAPPRPTTPAPTPAPAPAPSTPSVVSTARAPVAGREPMQCFKCKGFGHRRTECPSLLHMDIHGNPVDAPPEDDLEVDEYPGECPEGEDYEEPLGYIQITPAPPAPAQPVATLRIQQGAPSRGHTTRAGPITAPPVGPTPGTAPRPTAPGSATPPRAPTSAPKPMTPGSADTTQRTSIFYLYVKIAGRTYKLIVDSGICVNAIPEDTARKLGLTLVPLPMPYNV
ncbi:uncharacterized protein LOC144705893 [Wolffia australiana]